jgi:hypothetical protein
MARLSARMHESLCISDHWLFSLRGIPWAAATQASARIWRGLRCRWAMRVVQMHACHSRPQGLAYAWVARDVQTTATRHRAVVGWSAEMSGGDSRGRYEVDPVVVHATRQHRRGVVGRSKRGV